MEKELRELLIIGARVKLGPKYCDGRYGCTPGEIITLVQGEFDHDNGLYTETQTAPSVYNKEDAEFDSIFHLFGNDLDEFEDCEVITDSKSEQEVKND